MKKTKTLASVILSALIISAITVSAFAAGNISVDSAKSIALNHAGIEAADAVFTQAELDYDDGRAEYDVEFFAGNYEYDYEIDAVTGAVIHWEKEYESRAAAPATSSAPAGAEYIGLEAAKAIALEHAGKNSSEVRFTKAKIDYDDGKAHYDIEFRFDKTNEYDYEIDAVTGAIIEYDFDIEPARSASFIVFISNFFNWLFGRK